MSIRDRYLQRVCAKLPPLGSAEREKIRGGTSIFEYIANTEIEE